MTRDLNPRWSLLARTMGLSQIESWAELARQGQLSDDEFQAAKRLKLRDIGLDADTPLERTNTSPMAQETNLSQANSFGRYVDGGVLTSNEYTLVRRVLLFECGMLD